MDSQSHRGLGKAGGIGKRRLGDLKTAQEGRTGLTSGGRGGTSGGGIPAHSDVHRGYDVEHGGVHRGPDNRMLPAENPSREIGRRPNILTGGVLLG